MNSDMSYASPLTPYYKLKWLSAYTYDIYG